MKKLRILIDLSLCLHPYSGMGHETRLLLKALSQREGMEVTGLIYGRHWRNQLHNLYWGKNPSRQLMNQAAFLDQVIAKPPSRKGLGWVADKLRLMSRFLWKTNYRLQKLASDQLFNVIWRNYLHYSLEPSDYPVLSKLDYVISEITSAVYVERVKRGMRLPFLDTRGYDIIIFPDSTPVRVSSGTRKLIRFYDMVPLLLPDTLQERGHISYYHKSIEACRKDSLYICCSTAAQKDLQRWYPSAGKRSRVIPCITTSAFYPDVRPEEVPGIISRRFDSSWSIRLNGRSRAGLDHLQQNGAASEFRYLLAVSTIEPRKNYVNLLRAFEKVRTDNKSIHLVIVGSLGWKTGK